MRRKLVQQGESTLVVSLPAAWVRKQGLQKGDEVHLDVGSRIIRLAPGVTSTRSEIVIALEDEPESSIRAKLTNAYRAGHDIFRIRCSDDKAREAAIAVMRSRLLGMDVASSDEGVLVMESLTEPAGESYEHLLPKVFQNLTLLVELLRRALQGEDVREEVEEAERRIQLYDNFCRRMVTKGHAVDGDTTFLLIFLTVVIHANRDVYHATRLRAWSPRVSEQVERLETMLEIIKQAFLRREHQRIAELHVMDKEQLAVVGELLAGLKPMEAAVMHHVLSAQRKLYLANSSLLGYLFV